MVRLKCLLFEETLARVPRACKKITFCGAIDVLLGAVVSFSFSFVKKSFLWIVFSVIFRSVQLSTCWQNEWGMKISFAPGEHGFSSFQVEKVHWKCMCAPH